MHHRAIASFAILTAITTVFAGCFSPSTYTRDISGVYIPVDSIPRFDTVVLWTNIRPDSEGFFFHRFLDSSGSLRSDSGTFTRDQSLSDSRAHLSPTSLYDLDFPKWVQASDSASGFIEASIFRGYNGRVWLSVGVVQAAGHRLGGTYQKIRSVEYRPLSRFNLLSF